MRREVQISRHQGSLTKVLTNKIKQSNRTRDKYYLIRGADERFLTVAVVLGVEVAYMERHKRA